MTQQLRQCTEARTAARRDLLDADEIETAASLPAACPYSFDQLTDKGWYPSSRDGLVEHPW